MPELPLLLPSDDKDKLPERVARERGIGSRQCEPKILSVQTVSHNGTAARTTARKCLLSKHLRATIQTPLFLERAFTMTAAIASIQVGSIRTEGVIGSSNPLERKWTTGFYKYPIHTAATIHRYGLEGDSIADHRYHGGADKAVLGYGAENYSRWRCELSPADFLNPQAFDEFGPGAFAENLTITEQDETNVCIGDRYQIGSDEGQAVVLEVSQPRQPCWKISRRWQHRTLTKQVAATGRTGWYFRVLREGGIQAGDAVTLIDRPLPQWTLARANDLLLGWVADRYAVAELMQLEVLAAAWKKSLH